MQLYHLYVTPQRWDSQGTHALLTKQAVIQGINMELSGSAAGCSFLLFVTLGLRSPQWISLEALTWASLL